jgi:hypothetical protein
MIPHTVTGELAVDVSSPLMTFWICFLSLDQGGGGRLERLVQKGVLRMSRLSTLTVTFLTLGTKKLSLLAETWCTVACNGWMTTIGTTLIMKK